MDRLLLLKAAVVEYFRVHASDKRRLSVREWSVTNEVCIVLDPVAEVNIKVQEAEDTYNQPIMRIEDRLFDGGWVRSAVATRKCGNIYFRKYFMAVRKFTNIFVLLLILMACSRDTLFLVCFT